MPARIWLPTLVAAVLACTGDARACAGGLPTTGSGAPVTASAPPRTTSKAKKPTKPDPSAKPAPAAGSRADFLQSFERYLGTWLWIRSEGSAAESNPSTKGATRTLELNPDLTYALHQRRDTRDSVLCRGRYMVSEQSGAGVGAISTIEFEGWHEAYERRMFADFEGPDTLHLVGFPCESCPEHVFTRGRTTSFEGAVGMDQTFAHPLWDGLRFELLPTSPGWEIAVRDSARPGENLARLSLPLHGPNPRYIQPFDVPGSPVKRPENFPRFSPDREFIFSREVGLTIQGANSKAAPTEEEVERIEHAGRGWLTIQKDDTPGRLRFSVVVEEVMPRRPGG